MTSDTRYSSGTALWMAATAKADAVSAQTGRSKAAILRQFVFERLLARVFLDRPAQWVLKGGTAVLLRVPEARTTKDIDLFVRSASPDTVIRDLRDRIGLDLGDHFRFVPTETRPIGGENQPGTVGYRITVDAYCGTKNVDALGIDVVTGSLMTAEPDVIIAPVISLAGIDPPAVRVYPVVDHIADKLAAVQSVYGTARRPSSRVRDLVDLVVLANTQDVDGGALTGAISAEWVHRELPGHPDFTPPDDWRARYSAIARRVPACRDVTTFVAATELVQRFLAPAIEQTATGLRWEHTTRTWIAGHAPFAT